MTTSANYDQLRIAAGQHEKEKIYWMEKFSGGMEKVHFPYTGEDVDTGEYRTGLRRFEFNRELFPELGKVSGQSDIKLHMILAAAVTVLLYRYTGTREITIGMPIYKQAVGGTYINTVLALRNKCDGNNPFRTMLNQVRQTIMEAVKHQDYPIEILVEDLDMASRDPGDDFPLFDTAVLLENIHEKTYIQHIPLGMIFTFKRTGECLEGVLEYRRHKYDEDTSERIAAHLEHLLTGVLSNLEIRLSDIDILSQEEKKYLVEQLNRTTVPFPKDKTIHELFREQAKKTPGVTAVNYCLDLTSIYDELMSGDDDRAVPPRLYDGFEKCCFVKNPYLFQFGDKRFLRALKDFNEEEIRQLTMVRTHKDNHVALNTAARLFLDYLDGGTNLKSLFTEMRNEELELWIYPVVINRDTGRVYGERLIFTINGAFDNLLSVVRVLYRLNLIELADYLPGSVQPPSWNERTAGPVPGSPGEDVEPAVSSRDDERETPPVLLLGDRTATATTGLLYIASFLRRNGIEAYCQWNDFNKTTAALKKNIKELLAKYRPGIVGVSMKWFPHIARVLEICKIIKGTDPAVKIVVGGNTASYFKDKIIRYEWVDYVVLGDGEVPFLEICRGGTNIPNCVYKNDGKIVETLITYVQDEKNSSDIFISHMDEIFVSGIDPYLTPSVYINTGKGCSQQCFYCAGCREVQAKTFNRPKPFLRGIDEVRRDLIETKEYTSRFMFDFDLPLYDSLDYYRKIWEGIDLSDHFCRFYFWMLPSPEFIDLVVETFKYVYINIDMCSLSERHRLQLSSLKIVKPQPTDAELFAFFDTCEQHDNVEVIINHITGLPHFSYEDIEISERILSKLIKNYSCFTEMDWGRLHAQPGAPIVENCEKYGMHSYAKTYEDFLYYSRQNLEEEIYPELLTFNYPYIYADDETLNAKITQFYASAEERVKQNLEKRRRNLKVNIGLTYEELEEKSSRLACILNRKGTAAGSIAALGVNRSPEMIVGLLGILKAGAAYLPIDPDYPELRIKYMLCDSGTKCLLTGEDLQDKFRALDFKGEIIDIFCHRLYEGEFSQPADTAAPDSPAYVIYTSGSTGNPKGVMVEHRNVSRLVKNTNFIDFMPSDKLLLTGALVFDISTFEIWGPLLNGITLFLADQAILLDAERLGDILAGNKISILHLIPQLFNQMAEQCPEIFDGLRCFLVGGDIVRPRHINKLIERNRNLHILHMYGPTENTTFSTFLPVEKKYETTIPIGKPVGNSSVFILDEYRRLKPTGAVGEICVGGEGIARGYLNNPGLTHERFVENQFLPGHRLYRTGDLGRWLPDGNLEFSGRRDHQVKIRGFRIELGEIETQLLDYPRVKEAVVLMKETKEGDPYLAAYIVAENPPEDSQLREHLAGRLPGYMIPSYFIHIDKIPLTSNGKIDRKVLPDPEVKTGANYTAPRNGVEETLVEIWGEVLEIGKDVIGVDSNFFELGGHSLKATVLIARIHKAFNVKIPLVQIFQKHTVRELAALIGGVARERYVPVEPVEKKEYYALSSAQKRLYILQQMGRENVSYNIPQVLPLDGDIDDVRLEETFRTLIARHESLRTSFRIVDEEPVQKIHNDVDFEIECEEVETSENGGKVDAVIQDFVQTFDLSRPPLLRARLVKVGASQNILLFDMHHIITDGTSQGILREEFTALFAGEEPAPLRLHYKDYAEWQNRQLSSREILRQQNYWLKAFEGDIPVLNMPTDHMRPAIQGFEGSLVSFELDVGETAALNEMAHSHGATLFMVLLALYNVFLSKMCRQEDIVVGTPIAGRKHPDLQRIIGMFVNVLALRNYPSGRKSFNDFLAEVKERTLGALDNQDYQFEELVEKVAVQRDMSRNPIFDAVFALNNIYEIQGTPQEAGDREENKSKSSYTYKNRSTKFDLILSATEVGDKLAVMFQYSTNLFEEETILRFIRYFKELISAISTSTCVKREIAEIEIIPGEDRHRVLYELNDTGADYPRDRSIHQLFEEQAAAAPDRVALVGPGELSSTGGRFPTTVSYGELNRRSNRLARLLREKGVKPDTVVGIMVDRSIGMITGILGILKAGGAYLPINPGLPEKRVMSMLNQCSVPVLIAVNDTVSKHSYVKLQDIHGGGTKRGLHFTGSRPNIKNLDGLPLPDRSLVDYEKYNKYIGQSLVKNNITMLGSRGCPYNCAFCHNIWPKTHIAQPAEKLFEEVRIYYDMGVRRFTLLDDVFNVNIRNSTEFLELIVKNGLDIQLFLCLRGDILTEDYIDLMVRAGTVRIALALETASPRLQEFIGKKLDIERFRKNVNYLCEKYPHVILELNTIHGFPTETREEAMGTLAFIKALKWVHFPYVHILKIYPNTNMERLALESGISRRSIDDSADLAYHELPETLPFDKAFTLKYQAEFFNGYFMSRERLLHVMPYQMKVLTEDEMVQKYNSYLPMEIETLDDFLEFAGISREELRVKRGLDEAAVSVPGLNEKIGRFFPARRPAGNALNVLLLDLSQYFSGESDNMLYDVVEVPLGLIHLMSVLKERHGDRINGKIAKSRIDFDNYGELKKLVEDFKPDVVGIRTLTFYRNFFHKTIANLRQWGIDAPIIAGGPYATSDYKTVLRDGGVDLVVVGEGEVTFGEVVEKIMECGGKLPGKEVLKGIPGLAFMENGAALRETAAREIILLDVLEAECETGLREGEYEWAPAATDFPAHPSHLAYVLFTSGSTGNPKAVAVEHRNVTNLVEGVKKAIYRDCKEHLNVSMISPYEFDASVKQIFGVLLSGYRLNIVPEDARLDSLLLLEFLRKHCIDVSDGTAAHLQLLSEGMDIYGMTVDTGHFIIGGEALPRETVERFFQRVSNPALKVSNVYGPTECCDVAASFTFGSGGIGWRPVVSIGTPLCNVEVHILGLYGELQPIGIAGELCIAGAGVGRGYLNNPRLTAESFNRSYKTYKSYNIPLYRTGDLARWMPDGNVEFLGRIDRQVKIRGYRIELEEIENRLSAHRCIETSVVIAREAGTGVGESALCAYITPGDEIPVSELKEYLSKYLPEYMIPRHFVFLDRIPVTSRGKIDRGALPAPGTGLGLESGRVSPKNRVEEKLVEIWSRILELPEDAIGIDSGFFELGGHSLKAAVMMTRIHKELNTKLPLSEVFQDPTIRGIARKVAALEEDRFAAVEPTEKKEWYPLSPAQKRLYVLQKMTPGDTSYNMPFVFPLTSDTAPGKLEQTFKSLIARHESLRTSFVSPEGFPVQKISDNVEFEVGYYDAPDPGPGTRDIVRDFVCPFELSLAPLLRAALVRTPGEGCLLVVDMHHIITDGMSQNVLKNEYNALYAGEQLPPLRLHYRDYSQWLSSGEERARIARQEEYWLSEFEGGIPVLDMPTDFPRQAVRSFEGAGVRFEIGPEDTRELKTLALDAGATPYIVLLAIYNIFLSKISGKEDIIVGTTTAGRNHADLEKIIGMFVNTIALRNYPDGEKTVEAFIEEVKKRTLQAFNNQDYPFEDLVEKVIKEKDMSRNPLFDVRFTLNNLEETPRVTLQETQAEVIGPSSTTLISPTAKFDLTLAGIDLGDKFLFGFQYSTKLFKEETVKRFAGDFKTVMSDVLENRAKTLNDIDVSHDFVLVKSKANQVDLEF